MKRLILFLCISISLYSSPLDHALISIYAIDSKTQEVIIDEQSQLSLNPASCLKIIPTAAAIELLGKEMTFRTDLEARGPIEEGRLKGDLCIRGGGDPSLASPYFSSSWQAQIDAWASSVQKAGIEVIEGSVTADLSIFEKPYPVSSWEYEDVGNGYGAIPSALSFYDNLYFLTFNVEQAGTPATLLSIDPPLNPRLFHNELVVGPQNSGDKAYIYGSESSLLRTIRGTIPQTETKTFTIKGSLQDPAAVCLQLLKQELKKRGIQILDTQEHAPASTTLLHTTYSPPLTLLIERILHESHNCYTDHLVYTLGEQQGGKGSLDKGLQVIAQFLQAKQIDLDGFRMVDGSGLSRQNLMTTRQLVALLLAMKENPAFVDALSFRTEKIRGKTGSMTLTRGYAGYLNDIVFAIFINNCTDGKLAMKKIDETCERLLQWHPTQSQ